MRGGPRRRGRRPWRLRPGGRAEPPCARGTFECSVPTRALLLLGVWAGETADVGNSMDESGGLSSDSSPERRRAAGADAGGSSVSRLSAVSDRLALARLAHSA